MDEEKRDKNPAKQPAHEFTAAEIESISQDVAHEIAHTGLPPYPVITLLAQRYLQPGLDRQRSEQEARHENEIGLVGRNVLPALLRAHERDREQLEYAEFVQIRELASRIEEVYWSRALNDFPEALRNRHAAADRLLDKHRAEEAMLTRTHDEDLKWLHAHKNPRTLLAWPSRAASQAVDATLALRQLQEREWDVLKVRHEREICVKALVLEHEEDRAAALSASGKPSRDPDGPEKGGGTDHPPQSRRNRKHDLDFER